MTSRTADVRGIYFVTDPDQTAAVTGGDPIDGTARYVRAAVDAGVTMVQVRWKNADAGPVLDLVSQCAEQIAASSGSAVLVVNDRVDVFLASRERGVAVDGVHVGQTDLPVETVRRLIGDNAVLGLSASTRADLDTVLALPPGTVDQIGVQFRDTATKSDTPQGLGVDGMADYVELSPAPVVAIGGITLADLAPLAAAGVHQAAVVSAIAAAENPASAAAELVHSFSDDCCSETTR